MKNSVASFGLAAAGLLVALPVAAQGAAIGIDFSQPGGITFGANDFEYGLVLNGNLFQVGNNDYQQTTLSPNAALTFSGTWIDLGASTPGSRTVYFVDPLAPANVLGTFTFTYGSSFGDGTINGMFDPNGVGTVPGGTDPGDIYLANGSTYSFDNAFISVAVVTPTPGAAAVLGLAGVASLRRRRAV